MLLGKVLRVLRHKSIPQLNQVYVAERTLTDDRLLDAMIAHPILVNRPIVVTPKGTKLCRPSEVVLGLLDRRPPSFTKEDGEVVVL